MNPLHLLENDMATLMMSSKKVFEHWNDDVAEMMNDNCIAKIQQAWKTYVDQVNTRMNIYMMAEKKVNETLADLERKIK